MAAPRPEVTYYLDELEHAALKEFAAHDDKTMGKLTEEVMRAYLSKRVHDTSVLSERLQRAGIIPGAAGPAGKGRE